MKKTKFLTRTTGVLEKIATASGRLKAIRANLEGEEAATELAIKKIDETTKSLDKAIKDLNNLSMDYFIDINAKEN